jgi:hypothetical protein
LARDQHQEKDGRQRDLHWRDIIAAIATTSSRKHDAKNARFRHQSAARIYGDSNV